LIANLQALLTDLEERLTAAGHIFLALDFDGTLAPIAATPKDAAILPEISDRIKALLQSGRCTVAIVSGRSVADLQSKIDLDLIYAGNHGLEIQGRGLSFVHDGAFSLRQVIDHVAWDLEAAFHMVPGVIVERKGLTATVHYRQARTELTGWVTLTTRMITQQYGSQLRVNAARKAFDIRPGVTWDKGSAVQYLTRRAPENSLLVCAGDDETDEAMFAASGNAVSIKVGVPERTRARYYVNGIHDLLPCFDLLTASSACAVAASGD
jgi:trehalose 6-phosphate phosphatase